MKEGVRNCHAQRGGKGGVEFFIEKILDWIQEFDPQNYSISSIAMSSRQTDYDGQTNTI